MLQAGVEGSVSHTAQAEILTRGHRVVCLERGMLLRRQVCEGQAFLALPLASTLCLEHVPSSVPAFMCGTNKSFWLEFREGGGKMISKN